MTETPPEPQEGQQGATPPSTPPEGSEGSQGATDTSNEAPGGDPTDERAKLRREAARYRTERNAVREERDRLREQVAGFRRQEVERLAAQRLRDGSDLWTRDVELDSLLADDGSVDADAVNTAVDALVENKPHLRRPDPDFGGGARRGALTSQPSFGEMLKQVGGRR